MLLGSLTGRDPGFAPLAMTRIPRRILMTTDAVGGIWRWSLDAAEGLNERGIEVILACVGPAPGPHHRSEVQGLTDTSLIHVDEPLDWTASDEKELAGLPRRIDKLVTSLGIDLVHLNAPSQAVGLALDCPVVTVCHSCVATWFRAVHGTPPPAGWAWQVERTRRGLCASDIVLAPTASHAVAVVETYGPQADLRVVPNAVRRPPPMAVKENFILAAGRWWDEGKNGSTLDEAAADSPWPVRLAGALVGPSGTAIDLRHARALGELTSRDLRAEMARASIFVAPSRYEPFGLAAMEAALAGCALVCADISTFREIWDDAALFVDAADAGEMACAMRRLVDDPMLRADLGERARRNALAYSPTRQIDALVAVYSDVCRAVLKRDPSAAE